MEQAPRTFSAVRDHWENEVAPGKAQFRRVQKSVHQWATTLGQAVPLDSPFWEATDLPGHSAQDESTDGRCPTQEVESNAPVGGPSKCGGQWWTEFAFELVGRCMFPQPRRVAVDLIEV